MNDENIAQKESFEEAHAQRGTQVISIMSQVHQRYISTEYIKVPKTNQKKRKGKGSTGSNGHII